MFGNRMTVGGRKKPTSSKTGSTTTTKSSKDFGLSFPEFREAMYMLVTMLRDSKHGVGGRGESLGSYTSAAMQLKSMRAEEVKDDAWEAERALVEEKLIRLCTNHSLSTKSKSTPSVNTTIAMTPEEPLLLCHSGLIGKIHSVYALEFPQLTCPHAQTYYCRSWKQSGPAHGSKLMVLARYGRRIQSRSKASTSTMRNHRSCVLDYRPLLPRDIALQPPSQESEHGLDLVNLFSNHLRYGRQQDNGTNTEMMMSFENLKAFLTDFEIFPHHIDFQTLARVYRSVKLWEWAWCDSLSAKYENGVPLNLSVSDPLGFLRVPQVQ